jgi:NADH-quinone oxidoreductase subunit M
MPRRFSTAARIVALTIAVASLAIVLLGFVRYGGGSMQAIVRLPWIPSLGIDYSLSVDGISLVLLLLTSVIGIAGILFSWNVDYRTNEFFALYLILIGCTYGVFLSYDLFLFFVFYEIVIVPKYFLIAGWGSTRREYGAMKLALYSFTGSAMVLIGLIAAYITSGAKSMALNQLAQYPFSSHFQLWAFPLVFLGFAVLAGLWPFHTWAPTGHVAAPTSASMLLAGVVMKLGAYGCLRVAMVLFPLGLDPWGFHVLGMGSWRDVFALLAVVGIIYGALVALVQQDFKFVIGYSSISHMGFVLLGLMTLNQIGLTGAVIQMFSHGVLAGLLFAIVGRMVYDRTHTRELHLLNRMDLYRAIPFAAIIFVLAGMASMGLPGFSGFIAELMILMGSWRSYPLFAIGIGLGLMVGVAYIWRALQKAFFADREHAEVVPHEPLVPITLPERVGALLLIGSSIFVGIYPQVFLRVIQPALNSPLFSGLHKGSWQ